MQRGQAEQDENISAGLVLPAGSPARARLDIAPSQTSEVPPQGRRSSYTTLRPLLDGIRGIMDNLLTEASAAQFKPDPDDGTASSGSSQAVPGPANNVASGSKQRQRSLAAAMRYSNPPHEEDPDDSANITMQSHDCETNAGPDTMLHPTASTAAVGLGRSQRLTAEGLPYEPIKWQVPDVSTQLWEQPTSTTRNSAVVQTSQQLSWTARCAPGPQSTTRKQQPGGKKITVAGKKGGPVGSGGMVKQQGIRGKSDESPTQTRVDTEVQSSTQEAPARTADEYGAGPTSRPEVLSSSKRCVSFAT